MTLPTETIRELLAAAERAGAAIQKYVESQDTADYREYFGCMRDLKKRLLNEMYLEPPTTIAALCVELLKLRGEE